MPDPYFTIIHTDGGAAPNPGEGAYVAILQNGDKLACVRGYAPFATNQQMEQAAAIAGLLTLKSKRIPVQLVTDSQYVHNGAKLYMRNWRHNGWRNAKGDPLANLDLWQKLDEAMSPFVVAWTKCEGHSGVEMNIKADALVRDTRQAKGDPSKYQLTDIPEIKCSWNFNDFAHHITPAVHAEIDALRAHFDQLLKGIQHDHQNPVT